MRRVFTKDNSFSRNYPNLTEPDLTPTEFRSPLPAEIGRIEPTAIAFIFARHYLRPSLFVFPQNYPNLAEPDLTPTEFRSPLPAEIGRIEPTAIAFIFARHYLRSSLFVSNAELGIPSSMTLPYATKMSCTLYRRARRMSVPSRSESVAKLTNAQTTVIDAQTRELIGLFGHVLVCLLAMIYVYF